MLGPTVSQRRTCRPIQNGPFVPCALALPSTTTVHVWLCAAVRASSAEPSVVWSGSLARCSLFPVPSGYRCVALHSTLLEAHAPAGGEWMAVAEGEDDPTGSIRTPETGPCRVDAQVTRQTRSALYETLVSYAVLCSWRIFGSHCSATVSVYSRDVDSDRYCW